MATNNDHYNNGVVYRTPEGQLYDTSDQTYLMSPLEDVVVEATASPETKNRMQLEYNKKWQDWHKQYQDWWKNYKAAESKAEQSDMNNYVRKGMDDFGRNYVFPAMTTALTAGLPVISTAGKAAEVLWNPAATITSRSASPLIRGVGKAADVVGIHLPVYRETAADIASKVRGDKNWFTDQQGNFDPMNTAETVFAPFIGAGAVKEAKTIKQAISSVPKQTEILNFSAQSSPFIKLTKESKKLQNYPKSNTRYSESQDIMMDSPVADFFSLKLPDKSHSSLGTGQYYRAIGDRKALKSIIENGVIAPEGQFSREGRVFWNDGYLDRNYQGRGIFALSYDKAGKAKMFPGGKSTRSYVYSDHNNPIDFYDEALGLHARIPFTQTYIEIPKTQSGIDKALKLDKINRYVEKPIHHIKNITLPAYIGYKMMYGCSPKHSK